MNDPAVEALLAFYRTGCHHEFDKFTTAITPWMLNRIASNGGDSWADDILQNVLIKIATCSESARWNPESSALRSWLGTCIKFACIDQYKAAWARPFVALGTSSDESESSNVKSVGEPAASGTESPVESALFNEYQDKLNSLIQSYNCKDKKVILMSEFERKTYAEIGLETGIATATVCRRVNEFREQLAKLLS